MPIIEASSAMHLVKEIPREDQRKLEMMCNVYRGMSYRDLLDFATSAYKIGRETEAQRHQHYIVGTMANIEHIAMLRALEYTGYDVVKAASILEIGKTTMYRKIKEYGIEYGKKPKATKATTGSE